MGHSINTICWPPTKRSTRKSEGNDKKLIARGSRREIRLDSRPLSDSRSTARMLISFPAHHDRGILVKCLCTFDSVSSHL